MTDTSTPSVTSIAKPVIAGLARHALTALAGIMAADGFIQTDQESQFIDGGVAVVLFVSGAAWSWWQKRQTAQKGA